MFDNMACNTCIERIVVLFRNRGIELTVPPDKVDWFYLATSTAGSLRYLSLDRPGPHDPRSMISNRLISALQG